MEQNRESRNGPRVCGQLTFEKNSKTTPQRNQSFQKNSAETITYPYAKKVSPVSQDIQLLI